MAQRMDRFGGVRHQHLRPHAIFIKGQRCVQGVCTQNTGLDVSRQFALGIDWQAAAPRSLKIRDLYERSENKEAALTEQLHRPGVYISLTGV
jgi:hypothetical protein